MRNIKCADCAEYRNEWCEKVIDSPHPDMIRDCQYWHERKDMVEVIRCKDCKYFEYDHVEKLDGIPLIVAHEICTRWSDGVKTSENGYCFLGERGEADDD